MGIPPFMETPKNALSILNSPSSWLAQLGKLLGPSRRCSSTARPPATWCGRTNLEAPEPVLVLISTQKQDDENGIFAEEPGTYYIIGVYI